MAAFASAQAHYVAAQTMYNYARWGDYEALTRYQSSINNADAQGNTALCLAWAEGNTEAYNILRRYGANTGVPCMTDTPGETAHGSFGMGPVAWTLLGLAAVGGIAAAVSTDKSSGSDTPEPGPEPGPTPPVRDTITNKLVAGQGFVNSDIFYINEQDANLLGVSFIFDGETVGGENAYAGSGEYTSSVELENISDGFLVGMQASLDLEATIGNAWAHDDGKATGIIKLKNTGNGYVVGAMAQNVYNAGVAGTTAVSDGAISIENEGNGDVFGLYGSASAYNLFLPDISKTVEGRVGGTANGLIRIKNKGNGTSYGMVAGTIFNMRAENADMPHAANARVQIINLGNGDAYAMNAASDIYNNPYSASDTAEIEMVNTGSGKVVGLYSTDGDVFNGGVINIYNLGSGKAVGIWVDGTARARNMGNIFITRDSYTDIDGEVYSAVEGSQGDMAIGIYGGADTTIENMSGGYISISGAETAYGIYSEGSNVINNGIININGDLCTSSDCGGNFIKLNGGRLLQNGTLSAQNSDTTQPQSLDLDAMDGQIIATANAKFQTTGAISGTITVDSSAVQNGFDDVYQITDMVTAADVSGLKLTSQSALFDAALENGSDAVLRRKEFAEVTENASLAQFLQQNYAAQQNENLFNVLKSAESLQSLQNDLRQLSGGNTFNRFINSDLRRLREMNFALGQDFLQQSAKQFTLVGGVDMPHQVNTRNAYALSGQTFGNYSFGWGFAFGQTQDGKTRHDDNRQQQSFNVVMPISYKHNGYQLQMVPQVGYLRDTYDRYGFNSMSYHGQLEKNIFGVNNEVRYPLTFGEWTVAPTAEVNLLGYHLKGHENNQPYSLKIKSQNNYSLESGLGLTANRKIALGRSTALQLSSGAGVYHEFANPYDIEVGMNGMNGYFTQHDNKRSRDRAVIRSGFDFTYGKNLSFFGRISAYIDREYLTDVDVGLQYAF